MSEFDNELFNKLSMPWRIRERPLCDLKRKIPCVFGNADERNEFIRDLISFANTARRWGEEAYILYGVDNNGTIIPEGIKGQCTMAQTPEDWDDDDPSKFDHQQSEIIGRQLQQCAREYIAPPLNFDYVASRLSDGTLVSYIEVPPNPTSEHFEVRKSSRGGEKPLRWGECWRREGESKIPVKEHEKQFLYCFSDVPLVKMKWWRDHFERLAEKFERFEWEEKPYLPLFCKCCDDKLRPVREWVEHFLADARSHVLILVGRPGAGKTTFLRLLVGELADRTAPEAAMSTSSQPEQTIPVFFSLDGYVRDGNDTLARRIARQGLDQFGVLRLERASRPEKIFEDRPLRFLVCLDALDEMQQTDSEFREVQEFIDDHPNIKMIITCRVDALQRQWRERYPVSELETLSEDQIAEYLQARVEDPEGALSMLLSDRDLLHLVRVPLMLESAAEYWYDLEQSINQRLVQQIEYGTETLDQSSVHSIATVGKMLDRLFLDLFDHESGKSPVSGRDADAIYHMETLSDLARYMDGKQYQVSHRKLVEILRSEANIQKYRNLGILRRQRTHFAFTNRLAQVYFAAFGYRLLIEDTEEGVEQLRQEIRPDMPFWSKCIAILRDITYRDMSPLLALFQS